MLLKKKRETERASEIIPAVKQIPKHLDPQERNINPDLQLSGQCLPSCVQSHLSYPPNLSINRDKHLSRGVDLFKPAPVCDETLHIPKNRRISFRLLQSRS